MCLICKGGIVSFPFQDKIEGEVPSGLGQISIHRDGTWSWDVPFSENGLIGAECYSLGEKNAVLRSRKIKMTRQAFPDVPTFEVGEGQTFSKADVVAAVLPAIEAYTVSDANTTCRFGNDGEPNFSTSYPCRIVARIHTPTTTIYISVHIRPNGEKVIGLDLGHRSRMPIWEPRLKADGAEYYCTSAVRLVDRMQYLPPCGTIIQDY